MYDELVEFLQESVTPFHAAATAESWLAAAGFTRLEEADYWNLEPGKGYYITRNGSAVIAWRVPQHAIGGWRIAASHSDSPCWKIKADMPENEGCRRLSVEGYGGMIMASWLDRPLTVGGRVLVKTQDGVQSRLVYIDRDLLVIPSLAIHFQRDVNKGKVFNPQIDMQPLWGPAGSRTLTDLICEELGITAEEILDWDLQLVTRQAPVQIGPDNEYFMAPRIDDLECAATTLLAFWMPPARPTAPAPPSGPCLTTRRSAPPAGWVPRAASCGMCWTASSTPCPTAGRLPRARWRTALCSAPTTPTPPTRTSRRRPTPAPPCGWAAVSC